MAVRLSALHASHPSPPGRFLVLISVRVWVDPRTIVRLEEFGQLKNPMTSLGIKPVTFQLVAQCLNHRSIHKAARSWSISRSSRQPWSICGAGNVLENHDLISAPQEKGQGRKWLSSLDSKALPVCGRCVEYPPYRWECFNTENGGSMFPQNVDPLLHDFTVPHPRRQYSSSPSRETQIQGKMCLVGCLCFHAYENTLRNRTLATNDIQQYMCVREIRRYKTLQGR
jgi:hypothetical protein